MPSTWTTTLPTGTTKIRLAPNILRDRWLNIEQGEVPCDKWQLQRQAANPASIAGSGLIYTKNGGASNSELFYEDDDSPVNVIRLTRRGGVGYFGQKLFGSSVIMNQSTEFQNTQDGFCVAWGLVSDTGVLVQNYKISGAVRDAAGKYTVTFATAFATGGDYIVVATAFANGTSRGRAAQVTVQNAGSFSVKITSSSDTSDVGTDTQWAFAVFGGRA